MDSIRYEDFIKDIPDYPQPGVIFKDVTPLLANPKAYSCAIDEIAHHLMGRGITKVIGAEARGFLVGSPVAYRLGAGFVPARKPGKLPRETFVQTYALEYGTDELHIHRDAISSEDTVVIVDDLIATGGTALASAKLAKQAGAKIVGFAFLMELCFLHPREQITKEFDQEIFSLIKIQ